jgi:hypothetical protein
MTTATTIVQPATSTAGEDTIAAEVRDELTAIITARARAAFRLERANAEPDPSRQSELFGQARKMFAVTVEQLAAMGEAYWPAAERVSITDRGDLIAVLGGRLQRVVTLHDGPICEDVAILPAIVCETDATRHVCGRASAHPDDHECRYCGVSWPQSASCEDWPGSTQPRPPGER